MHSTLECSISLWDRAITPQWELSLRINDMPDLWCSSTAEGSVWLHLHTEDAVIIVSLTGDFPKVPEDRSPFYLQNLFTPLPEVFWADFCSMWIATVPLILFPAAIYSKLQQVKSYFSAWTPGWNGWAWVKVLKKRLSSPPHTLLVRKLNKFSKATFAQGQQLQETIFWRPPLQVWPWPWTELCFGADSNKRATLCSAPAYLLQSN